MSVYFNFLKLKVDALSNPLIMRPTSSDIGTTNFLKFNKLGCSERVERATIKGSTAVEMMVDSASKRCMIRLPLREIAASQVFEAKRVSRKKL
ncbi:hypothetical protein, partial [Pseudomonas plecoglossicida]